jgi:hypothetical protein
LKLRHPSTTLPLLPRPGVAVSVTHPLPRSTHSQILVDGIDHLLALRVVVERIELHNGALDPQLIVHTLLFDASLQSGQRELGERPGPGGRVGVSDPCIEGLELRLGEHLFIAEGVSAHLHLIQLLSWAPQQVFRLRQTDREGRI